MKIKLPDTLVLLLGILFVFAILTWIIPAGNFEREIVDGREIIVPGSFQFVEQSPANFSNFILAPIKGFISSTQIIVFIFFIAGAFGIINRTNAIAEALQKVVENSKKNPKNKSIIIFAITLLFSVAGATFGMSEEVLVFILITLPLSFSLGYDSLLGISIPFLGAGAGFAGAFINPFTVGIAQGIADLAPFSGWEYRLIIWLIFTITVIVFLILYAKKIEKDPGKSLMYELDKSLKYKNREATKNNFNLRHKLILLVFATGLILLIIGVNQWEWYINEISALFVLIGVISALINKMPVQETIDSFIKGGAEMLKVCFVIAIAKGILIIVTDGKIIDTILYYMSSSVEDYPKTISVQLMFFVQSGLNFFLPSGSGQAALTMPIMAPLSDIIGVSRQTSVLAFQLGDGLSNMVIPTSGITMGVLTIANIPYQTWIKWIWPLMLCFVIIAILVLIPPVLFFYWA